MRDEVKKRISHLFEGVNSSLGTTDPEWVDIVAEFSLDERIGGNRLTEREKMLCILSALLGCQGMGEFQNMLHGALNTGLDPIAVKEVIYQAAAYLGIGRTHDFLVAANQIMEQHGIKLPLPPQAATSKETRLEDGLAKQVALFGPDMAKRQR